MAEKLKRYIESKSDIHVLTPTQDRLWLQFFEEGLNGGMTDLQADKFAYNELVKRYPKIKGHRIQ